MLRDFDPRCRGGDGGTLPGGRLDYPREQLVVTYLPCRRVDARRGVTVGYNFCHAV